MQGKKLSLGLAVVLTILFAVTMTGTRSDAQTEKVLYSFSKSDGLLPYSGVVFDTAGNLYGTTFAGGNGTVGVVYELSPSADGGWTQKVLHTFTSTGTDGFDPYATPILDVAGNLYGTTGFGGVNGFGTVYEMVPTAGGAWMEKVIHSFNTTNGEFPQAGLISDSAGNLYGTTSHGGSSSTTGACSYGVSITGCGTAFQLKRKPGVGWVEKVLYNFNRSGTEAYDPIAGLVFDSAGNLYGTTVSGGTYGYGTVFKLSPTASSTWTETILHSFNLDGTDGAYPGTGGLIFDASGNLYGTTVTGGSGANPEGTVFELTPGAGGAWSETVLHSFQRSHSDGYSPGNSTLIFDASGNLYGTTQLGGAANKGTVFKLSPSGGGNWTETLLYQFGALPDGEGPVAGLVFDTAGNLYGTTANGGAYGNVICGSSHCGTVFVIRP
jgi:uncharacterized repeat protein (TIGR03803 family)